MDISFIKIPHIAIILSLTICNCLIAAPLSAQNEDLLQLNIELLENRYSMNKSETNRALLSKAYSDYLSKRCRSTDPSPIAERQFTLQESCIRYVDALLKIEPTNDLAPCLRDGAKSPNCKSIPGSNGMGLTPSEYNALTLRLNEANRLYSQSQTTTDKKKLINIYLELVLRYCPQISRESFTAQTQLSNECTIYAQQIIRLDPNNNKAQCYVQGAASEICKKLIEIIPDSKESESGTGEDQAGFKSF